MLCRRYFFTLTAPPEIYTLSLHDALPISRAATGDLLPRYQRIHAAHPGTRRRCRGRSVDDGRAAGAAQLRAARSEEHTSELQSHHDLVCRLLLEKKKKMKGNTNIYNETTI